MDTLSLLREFASTCDFTLHERDGRTIQLSGYLKIDSDNYGTMSGHVIQNEIMDTIKFRPNNGAIKGVFADGRDFYIESARIQNHTISGGPTSVRIDFEFHTIEFVESQTLTESHVEDVHFLGYWTLLDSVIITEIAKRKLTYKPERAFETKPHAFFKSIAEKPSVLKWTLDDIGCFEIYVNEVSVSGNYENPGYSSTEDILVPMIRYGANLSNVNIHEINALIANIELIINEAMACISLFEGKSLKWLSRRVTLSDPTRDNQNDADIYTIAARNLNGFPRGRSRQHIQAMQAAGQIRKNRDGIVDSYFQNASYLNTALSHYILARTNRLDLAFVSLLTCTEVLCSWFRKHRKYTGLLDKAVFSAMKVELRSVLKRNLVGQNNQEMYGRMMSGIGQLNRKSFSDTIVDMCNTLEVKHGDIYGSAGFKRLNHVRNALVHRGVVNPREIYEEYYKLTELVNRLLCAILSVDHNTLSVYGKS